MNSFYSSYFQNINHKFKINAQQNRPFHGNNCNDVGRVPLGCYNDEESIRIRKLIENSVKPETLMAWEAFPEAMREKTFIILDKNAPIPKIRTYPKKEKSVYVEDADMDNQASTSISEPIIIQEPRVKFDGRFKLNRKIDVLSSPIPSTSPKIQADPLPSPIPDVKIKVTINNDDAERRRQAREQLASMMKRKVRMEDVLGESEKKELEAMPLPDLQASPGLALLSDYGFDSGTKEECVLFKYGHCWDPQNCQFSHNGAQRTEKVSSDPNDWERKHPGINLCPGYLSSTCWNVNCNLRHVLYATDEI